MTEQLFKEICALDNGCTLNIPISILEWSGVVRAVRDDYGHCEFLFVVEGVQKHVPFVPTIESTVDAWNLIYRYIKNKGAQ